MRLQLIGALLLLSGVARADDWRISQDTLLYTDTDNVVVVSPQVAVQHPTDEKGGSASARVVVDVVSAASVDVISHATERFSDVRTEVDLGASYNVGAYLPSLSYRYSEEIDYRSHGFGLGLQRELGSNDSTLGVDYALTLDTVGYTGTAWSSFAEDLTSHAATLTFTQVLGPKSLLRGIYTLTVQSGYMAKPYRFVPLFDQAGLSAAKNDGVSLGLGTFDAYRLDERPVEQVPDLRVGHAVGARYLRYLDGLPGSLRVDGMLYVDSWGVLGGTAESALTWKRSEKVTLAAYGRLYAQRGADFWRRVYVVSGPGEVPRWRTLDRDLSPYFTVSGGLRYERHGTRWSGYLDVGGMETRYSDYLFLTSRFALVTEAGLRLEL